MDAYNRAIKYLRDNKTINEDDNYKLMELLVNQYSYGLQAKRDLESLLSSMQC